MNMTKRITALFVALTMMLGLAACGGGKDDPALGKYIGESVRGYSLEWMPIEDIYDEGENYVELKSGGKGVIALDGSPSDIKWELEENGTLTLSRFGSTCTGTLKDGLITLDDYFGYDLGLTFRKEAAGSDTAAGTTLSLNDFAKTYGGDWIGMGGIVEANGRFAEMEDTARELMARLVFDGKGGCEVWVAMYLDGSNEDNFANLTAVTVPNDETGLELRGTFMGGEIQEGILSLDEGGALYISCEVGDPDGDYISLLGDMRRLGDNNWTDDDYLRLDEDVIEYLSGKSFMEIAQIFQVDTGLIPDADTGTKA